MSPPTSTLSYIFPAKIRGPGGEVLRAASLTQMTTPSEEKSWGRGARPRPPPRLATRARGRPLPKVPRLSRPAAPPVPGEKPGSCVCWGRRGPSTPPRNARPRPGNSAASPRGGSRLESHGVRGRAPRLPKCSGRGRDRRWRGGGHGALPPPRRGSRASPGRGLRVGVGTPRGPASSRRVAGAPMMHAAGPHPQQVSPSPAVPPPFLRPDPSRRRPCLNPFQAGLAAAGETRGLRP